jgi:hypothetical protein
MKIQVTTLHHCTDHGNDLTVHPSADAAQEAKYQLAVDSWDNLWCIDGSDCSVSGCQGVPLDPRVLDRDTAIVTYFGHRAAFEQADIDTFELDMPLATMAGDWVRRAQREVDLAYAHPRSSDGLRALIEELLSLDTPDAV